MSAILRCRISGARLMARQFQAEEVRCWYDKPNLFCIRWRLWRHGEPIRGMRVVSEAHDMQAQQNQEFEHMAAANNLCVQTVSSTLS